MLHRGRTAPTCSARRMSLPILLLLLTGCSGAFVYPGAFFVCPAAGGAPTTTTKTTTTSGRRDDVVAPSAARVPPSSGRPSASSGRRGRAARSFAVSVLGATVAPASTPAASSSSSSSPRNGASEAAAALPSSSSSSLSSSEFHDELRRLADRANDPHHNPIAAAARTEEAWRSTRIDGVDTSAIDDVVFFNIVLKAWRDCCHCLAENDVKFDASDQVQTSWSLPESTALASFSPKAGERFMMIITPYDAARHALQLLTDRKAEGGGGGGGGGTDTASHNLVMDAFVKSRHRSALDHVTSIFHTMALQSQDSKDNNKSSGGGKDPGCCVPDAASWNTLLEASAYREGEDRLDRVEDVWRRMQQSPCRPNTRTINTVLHAYGRADRGFTSAAAATTAPPTTTMPYAPRPAEDWDGRAERCEEVFRSMTDQPDAATFTNLMMVHSRRGTLPAAERAEELFRELERRHGAVPGSDRYRPTVHTYTALIHAWGAVPTRDAAPKAEEWLQRLLNDARVQPNTRCYNACLQAWSRSTDPVRAAKALMLLQKMKKDPSTKPNRVSYLAALSACKITNGTPLQQTAALKVAFALFRSAENDSLHHGLYGSLLRVVSTLLPPDSAGEERDNVSTAVFRKAVKDGRVTKDVVRALQQASSAETFHSLLDPAMVGEHGEILFHKIPPSWSKYAR